MKKKKKFVENAKTSKTIGIKFYYAIGQKIIF